MLLGEGKALFRQARLLCSKGAAGVPTKGAASTAAREATAAGAAAAGSSLKRSETVLEKVMPGKVKSMMQQYGPAAVRCCRYIPK